MLVMGIIVGIPLMTHFKQYLPHILGIMLLK